jgi:hypothetical protein
MKRKILFIAAGFALTALTAQADEKSAQLDDVFLGQSAAQVTLAVQAQQCELRSTVWRDKLIAAVKQRLSKHIKQVRPTWSDPNIDAITGQILYGAYFGAVGDIGAPPPDSSDIMKMGEQSLAKSMACQVVQYRKSDLLYLDRIVEDAPNS